MVIIYLAVYVKMQYLDYLTVNYTPVKVCNETWA